MSTSTLAAPSSSVPSRSRGRPGPVLVATDARAGAGALRAAHRFAARSGVDVRVVAVSVPLPSYFGPIDLSLVPLELGADRRSALRERVQRQIHDVLGADVAWPIDVRDGDAAHVVCDVAREHDAALVVVGAGRYHLLDRLLAEQTALRIVRHADRPVLTVPEDYDARHRTVVVATDFSPAGAYAAEVALTLAETGATVHLVHAWSQAALIGAMPGEMEVPAAFQQVLDVYARELPEQFARLRALLDVRSDLRITTEVVDDRIAHGVLAFARTHGADFVAAGRQARTFFERLVVGSTTAALVRGAECAILVVPEPSPADTERLERALSRDTWGDDPALWRALLDGFTQRNAGRPARLTVDDPTVRFDMATADVWMSVTQIVGYPLVGIAYDVRSTSLTVMLGAPPVDGPHLMRTLHDVTAVNVVTDADGQDCGLRVRHGDGQTHLAFLPTVRKPDGEPTIGEP